MVQPQTWNHHGKSHTHTHTHRKESQLYSLTCIIGHRSIDRKLAMLNDHNSVVPNWRGQRLDALFRSPSLSLSLSLSLVRTHREKEQRQHYQAFNSNGWIYFPSLYNNTTLLLCCAIRRNTHASNPQKRPRWFADLQLAITDGTDRSK